jgi:ribose/xylose/arabinose/galactoside ABC-type transport system permease subunit
MSDSKNTARPAWRVVLGRPWVGPLVALAAVYGVFAALRPDTFTGVIPLETMLLQTVIVALCAVGMTLIIVQGGIDLSVGSMVALVTVVVARQLKADAGPLEAALIGMAAGTACGLANGLLVTGLGVTPFIITLGTMSILRGAAKGLAHEQMISAEDRGLHELMALLGDDYGWLVLPIGVWIAVIVAILGAVLLSYTRLGRHIIAVGSNVETARLCGVRVGRTTVVVYAIGGLLAGLAGVLEYGRLTVGDPTDSIGLELKVIAAVVIGGGSLDGGRGSVAGAMVGALLMTVIDFGCGSIGLANWVQEILTGVIIIVAVAVDRWRQR